MIDLQKKSKWSCAIRLVRTVLIGLVLLFVALKLYSNTLIRRAEAKYPPAEFVTVEDVRLHYVDKGSGRPMVFIPGGSGKVQDFTLSPVFEPATANHRTLVFDRPGLGYSQKPANEAATPAVQARLLHAAFQKLKVDRPVLVGQSWGGVIALAYAQTYPDDLAGIVLLGSSPYPREGPPESEPIYYRVLSVPVLSDLLLETVYAPVGRHLVAPLLLEESVDSFAPLKSIPPHFYDATLQLAVRPSVIENSVAEASIIPPTLANISQRLERVDVPVMIIAGGLDDHAMEAVPRLKQDLPQVQVIIVEDADHYLWFAYPEVVLDAIRQIGKEAFHQTGVYRYYDVPADVFEGLQQASSKGRYMRGHIIDMYPYEKKRGR